MLLPRPRPLLAAGILASAIALASGKAEAKPDPRQLLSFQQVDASGPVQKLGLFTPSTFSAAALETTYFGGTFWNADSSRWEALRDQVWTFDTGVGSSLVPPGGSTYPGVNPYKQAGLHQTLEGWVGIDNTFGGTRFFRRISQDDPRWSQPDAQGICVGSAGGLAGTTSFWAGVFAEEANALCYAAGQGYGNSWHVCIGQTFQWTGGSVSLSFKYRNDTEPGFDFTYVILDTLEGDQDDRVILTEFDDANTGTASFTLAAGVELPSASPADVTLKFCVDSDGLYSDQDGLYATSCGAFAVDDIVMSGGITHSATFETGDDGWAILPNPPGSGGEWSNLVHLNDLPPPLAACTCALEDTVLVFEDLTLNGHGMFQDNLAASPWIDLRAHGLQSPGKFIQTNVYADLRLLNYIFLQLNVQWYPALCLSTGKLVQSEWTSNGFVYYFGGIPTCTTAAGSPFRLDFSAFIPPEAEQVRLGLGVLSYCRFFAECTNVSNSSPWLDRVALGVYGTPGTPLIAASDIDLPQDAFPENGLLQVDAPGRIDRASFGDSLVVVGSGSPQEVRVQFAVHPGPGVDLSKLSSWLDGHPLEEHKGGLDWYSARMDTAETGAPVPARGQWMTAYHEEDPNFAGTDRDTDPGDMNPQGGITRLRNDIFPDDLLTPGSRLQLFYKTRHLGSAPWYVIPDTTGGNVYEMEILPSSMEADGSHNAVLYVDYAEGFGNERLMHGALSQAVPGGSTNFENTAWDRWDLRAPSGYGFFGRIPGLGSGATFAQILGYHRIFLDSGNSGANPLTTWDADVLIPWLEHPAGPARNGLYLAGDNLVQDVLTNPYLGSARHLLQDLAAVAYRCLAFRNQGCPSGSPADPTPCVTLDDLHTARTVSQPRLTPHMGHQGNGCPDTFGFDLMLTHETDPNNVPVPEERYEGNLKAGPYASVSNARVLDPGGVSLFRTVVDGVSLHHRRDPEACGPAPGTVPRAMVERLREVLTWFDVSDSTSTAAEDLPVFRTVLAPAAPNPVPAGRATRIAFSLARDTKATVGIYALSGRLIKVVFTGEGRRGWNEAVWDLRDQRGQPVASGVYVYRLESEGTRAARKLVVAGSRSR